MPRTHDSSGRFKKYFTPEKIAELRQLRGVEGLTPGKIAALWGPPFTPQNIYWAAYREGIKTARRADEKFCALPECGVRFTRRPDEERWNWARRKCCCAEHGRALAMVQRFGAKTCPNCKEHAVPYGKEYCSAECRRQKEARSSFRARRVLPPFTGRYETPEEYLARGGTVTRVEVLPAPLCGTPVYYKSGVRRQGWAA